MIEFVTVTNYRNESITVTLESPEKSGFFIERIDGLEPPKAIINSNPLFGSDGNSFNSARVNIRNVVISLGFYAVDTKTIEDLRQESYRMFPLKKQVGLRIKTTNRDLYTIGYVESNVTNIFSEKEKTTISILCMDPYLKNYAEPLHYDVYPLSTPTFTFPFSDDLDFSPTLQFGTANIGLRRLVINNDGDAPVGAIFSIVCYSDVSGLIIQKEVDGFLSQFMYFQDLTDLLGTAAFLDEDEILISTVKGDKYAYITREGVTYNAFNYLVDTPGMSWISFDPGESVIVVNATDGSDGLVVSVIHEPKYEGI